MGESNWCEARLGTAHQGPDRRLPRPAGADVAGRAIQAAQAPRRRRAHPGGQTHKKAAEDQRIATAKVDHIMTWLANLRRTEPAPTDNIIFPMWYAPVLIMKDGKRTITPMRYH